MGKAGLTVLHSGLRPNADVQSYGRLRGSVTQVERSETRRRRRNRLVYLPTYREPGQAARRHVRLPPRAGTISLAPIYVTDGCRNAQLHRFSGDGLLVSTWCEPDKEGPKQFHLPQSVFVDEQGTVFVCGQENNRTRVFSADWRFGERWSDKTQLPCPG